MRLRSRLSIRYWRRRWCLRHGHPIAPWAPTVVQFHEPDRLEVCPDCNGTGCQYDPRDECWKCGGTGHLLIEGRHFAQRAYRCAEHDDITHERQPR